MNRRIAAALIALVFAGGAGWYLTRTEQQKETAASRQPPAVSVTLATATQADVPVRLEANGYVSPLNNVEVRPQVSNIVAKVHIREGQFVKAGDLLFSLDDRADRVNLQKAQALLAKDQAGLADLERQLARSRELLGKGFISQSAVDSVQTQVEAARATLRADRAALDAARVALGYDTIRAAAAGRAGAISVFAGSLVQPSATAAPMVAIAQIDPIAVTFTLPESELGALLAAQKSGGIRVSARLPGSAGALEGKLSFVDNTVDPQSGTIKVKAVFPNADHRLWPGQYVPVTTVVRELKNAVVIPQAAVINGIDTRAVYVVGADRTAQLRRVELLHSFGTQAAVRGVAAGDSVVVDGKQNVRPGGKVRESDARAGGAQKSTQ